MRLFPYYYLSFSLSILKQPIGLRTKIFGQFKCYDLRRCLVYERYSVCVCGLSERSVKIPAAKYDETTFAVMSL